MEVTCTEVSAEPGGRRRAPAVVGRHVGHTQHREGGSKDGEVDKPARWGTRPRRRPGNRQRKKFQGQETSSFRCYRRPGGNERWPHWGNLEVAGVTFRKPFPWRVCVCVCQSLSHVRLFAIPWTVACQAPLSMEFSRQEYWSGLPFPSPGDLPDPGTNPGLLHCRQILYCLSKEGRVCK